MAIASINLQPELPKVKDLTNIYVVIELKKGWPTMTIGLCLMALSCRESHQL